MFYRDLALMDLDESVCVNPLNGIVLTVENMGGLHTDPDRNNNAKTLGMSLARKSFPTIDRCRLRANAGSGVDQTAPFQLVGCAPNLIPPLPGYLADQGARFHPSKVALDGGAAGAGQGLGHRG